MAMAMTAPQVENAPILDFINNVFPNEASLIAVEPLIQKLRNKIRRGDAEILAAVRQQSSSGTKAKEDLADAMRAIEELANKIREIKSKAEQSEVMVQELCRDIKKLDFAKKHITTTITALHRLSMLVSAVEQLQGMASKRQYKEAAGQLEAVNQLCGHFEAYKDVPKINELRGTYKTIKETLKAHVFNDFSSLGTAGLKEDGNLMQQLADACFVVDALERTVREELIVNICSKELTAYQQIFQGTEVAKLDKVERRYAWIKRQLRANEDIWQIFPAHWRVAFLLCMQFCKVTRAQLLEILDGLKEQPDVQTLLQALQRTLEFEEELAERFGMGSDKAEDQDEGEGDEQSASALRRKYEKQLAVKGGRSSQVYPDGEGTEKEKRPEYLSATAANFSFRGIISSCFESHLGPYVELEEKNLLETLEKLVMLGIDSYLCRRRAGRLKKVFLVIKKSLKRCVALTKNQTLFSLYKVFQRVLRAYAGKLIGRLPKVGAGAGLVAVATGMESHLRVSDKDERVICYIVNTAEYCHETAGQLGENISRVIDSQFAESIDLSEEQDEFSGVITKALSSLVMGLETRLENELAAMTRVPWGTIEGVGDQSEYVNGISSILSSSIPVISGLLSPLYFQFFLDKLAASFAPRFYMNIYKCKRITETGAQQMLLDTQAVKTILLEVPALGGQTAAPASYTKYVTREIGKAEALLKVILSPIESIADTYHALLPEGSGADFQRLLDLKGLKKSDQQPLLDYFTKRGMGTLLPVSPASGPSSPLTPSAASREAMMARAAALGRGAMAQSAAAAAAVSSTGLRRFFALAESAKEGAAKREGAEFNGDDGMAMTEEEEQRSRRSLFSSAEVASNPSPGSRDSTLARLASQKQSQSQSESLLGKRPAPISSPAPCSKRQQKSPVPYRCRDLPRRPSDAPRATNAKRPAATTSTTSRKLTDIYGDPASIFTSSISSPSSSAAVLSQETREDHEEEDLDAVAASLEEFVRERRVELRGEEEQGGELVLLHHEERLEFHEEHHEQGEEPGSPRTPPASSSTPAAPVTPMAPLKRGRAMVARPRPPPSAVHRRLNFDH
ncbi:hypothetical protein SELMODRAFT_421950 [Selaginella moellendorffii]|uniref:Uncharacterized protein n=1 Tax=Selaginella moellendorffii TaxID=88036 RepID=D8SGV8_SELML|nr:hypothetical protein SELMODRAFT_421950 [Selaginella moellendorffii]